jgi:hypothetical protein
MMGSMASEVNSKNIHGEARKSLLKRDVWEQAVIAPVACAAGISQQRQPRGCAKQL